MVRSPRVKAFSGKLATVETSMGGKLEFGPARECELDTLKQLYDGVWGKGLEISKDQLGSQMEMFREGQIVGRLNGKPVSMINVMLTYYGNTSGIKSTYDQTTGDRTFSTHVEPKRLHQIVSDTKSIPIALCVSIAVEAGSLRNGAAIETLNYARRLANESGLYVVPYSAPRSFGTNVAELGEMSIDEYLSITRHSGKLSYEAYARRLFERDEPQDERSALKFLLREEVVPIELEMFERLSREGVDIRAKQFLKEREFCRKYFNRELTIEEFCLAYGRELIDVVLSMHMKNGARFIRDGNGTVVTFDNSRLDPSARNYNVPMTYDPHPYFNNDYF